MRKGNTLTTEQFIERARAKHGDKYDYSRVEYIDTNTPVIIGCPVHGWREQKPCIHLITNGCRLCGLDVKNKKIGDAHRKQTDFFIQRAKELHEGIDYSMSEYKGANQPITMRCIKHDYTYTISKAGNHTCRTHPQRGCKMCKIESISNINRVSFEEFVFRARFIHGDLYEYDESSFVDMNTPMTIICKEHGPFEQEPVVHVNQGCGCQKCGARKNAKSKTYTQEEIIAKFHEVHGDRYTYECTVYKGIDTPILVNCRKHGPFETTPHNFIHAGSGCPKCNNPKLEGIVESWLKENGIAYETQKKFPWLKNVRNLVLDFFLPEYNVAIECQGDQHFTHSFKTKKRAEYMKGIGERDKLKHDQCEAHDIPIIYFVNKDSTCIPERYFGPIVKDKIELLFEIFKHKK